jgi:hypothetical protein
MSFSCSILLEDLDINCNKNVGGITKVVLGLQKDLDIAFDATDETIITQAQLADHVVFEHNNKDSVTNFSETKVNSNGLGVISTEILIRIPFLDRKMNQIDYMSRRQDLVCIMYHNNGTATISGWMDALTMNYTASSGASKNELSYIDISLVTDSWIASMACSQSVIDLN